MSEAPLNWNEWKAKYGQLVQSQRAKGSPVSYEWEFAGSVLRHVSGLPASRVVPQQEFVGENGQILHMDFGIEVNGNKIAIEVEGFDKTGSSMGKTMTEHSGWAARQRALEKLGWKVIAITNKDFMTNPVKYQRLIEDAMTTSITAEKVTPAPLPVVVKVQYEKPKAETKPTGKAEKTNGLSTGSVLVSFAGGIALIAAVVGFFANTDRYEPPIFPNPSNPNCDDFSTRAQLNEWAKRNPQMVITAHLDDDGDGLTCESKKFSDD
jgi:hypothetical protein